MTNNSHKEEFTFIQWFIARSDRIKNGNGYTFRWNYITCTFKITLFSAPERTKIHRGALQVYLVQVKLNFIAAWQVTCGMVIKADAITKRLLIKQTKLQQTYLRISVLTLNNFKPGIQHMINNKNSIQKGVKWWLCILMKSNHATF